MSEANLRDRKSVERLYPREAHDQDAAENARPKATVHHGVQIDPSPGNSASLTLVRTSRQVGEAEASQDAVFLYPVRVQEGEASTGYAAPSEGSVRPDQRDLDAYEAFVSRIIQVAEQADPPAPIGAGEERLKGFHGG